MKFLLIAFVLGISCNKSSPSKLRGPANTNCLFAAPLVLGASVSAGHGTGEGPADVVAKLLNPEAQITNKAISGATSLQITRDLSLGQTTPSIVMGLDLFFWDAAKNQCGDDFVASTKKFFSVYQSENIPMVVGKIPMGVKFPAGLRLAGTRSCSRIINELLEELCTLKKNCLLYDPKDCISEMGSPGSPEGVSYFNDQLHTSKAGNEFCAKQFVEARQYEKLKCF